MRSDRDTLGNGADTRQWFPRILGALAAFALAALPALAGGGLPPLPGSNGEGPLASGGGDETVGTLPIVVGDRGTLEFTRFWRTSRPAFYLEGSVDEIHQTILAAQGSGHVSVETLDPATRRIRLTFHGDIELTLDRLTFHGGQVAVGLAVPRGFGVGRMTITAGARAPVHAALQPGFAPIPLLGLESSGALDAAAFDIRTLGRTGARTAHVVDATPDVLILSQSY